MEQVCSPCLLRAHHTSAVSPQYSGDVHAIKHAFTAHMETIMRRYKRSGLSKSEKAHLKSMLRRYSRKYQLFRQRRFLAYMFKPLQKHIDMVEYLGVDGMSSDESEMEDVGGEHHVQYLIRSPRWRARLVSVWLRMFDSLHNILREVENLSHIVDHFHGVENQLSSRA
ncbi:hypothetical protein C8R43DRAFT_877815 [Mycena crocata]|nr:hypothetical protein C8R43DRAFT_877815 [Mycena crocata]